MGKIQIQPIASLKPTKVDIEQLTQEALAVTRRNDEELTELEINHERQAISLHIEAFPRIHPFRATIGFLVRKAKGGNNQAIEYIRMSLPSNAFSTAGKNALAELVMDFDKLDLSSQQRVDCLDWLCRKNKVTIMRFIDAMKDGIVAFHNNLTQMAIAEKKPDLAAKIFKDAMSEGVKSVGNKRLAADIGGLTGDKAPLVNIDQSKNINVQNNNNLVLSFSDFVKENDKIIRKPKQLEEKDYIDAEVVDE